jgi:hypothetical protein
MFNLSNLFSVINLGLNLKKAAVGFALLLGLFGGLFAWHKHELSKALAVQQVTLNSNYDKKHLELKHQVNIAQLKLSEKLIETERKKDEEIRSVNVTHARIVAGLRDRLTRSEQAARATNTTGTANSTATGMCTGVELSREDSNFLCIITLSSKKLGM